MLGFVGVGNMAGAILEGGLASGVIKKDQVLIYDINKERQSVLESRLGVQGRESVTQVVSETDHVLIGLKPDGIAAVLATLDLSDKALISIAAGWGSAALRQAAPGARVLRVMPNTPALVRAGMTALSKDHTLSADEADFAEALFSSIGLVEWVDEDLMDAVVGVSGSGSAYAFLFIEAMADGGVAQGLSRPVALKMAAQTLLGAAKLALESGRHPGELKDMVASPAGTTIEAIRGLEQAGFRRGVIEAVCTAADKAKRLHP